MFIFWWQCRSSDLNGIWQHARYCLLSLHLHFSQLLCPYPPVLPSWDAKNCTSLASTWFKFCQWYALLCDLKGKWKRGCSSFPGEFKVKQFLVYMWADSFWTHIPVYLPSLWCREALMRYSEFPHFCVILAVSDLWIKMAVICNLETRNLALTLWFLLLLPF